MIMYLCTTVVNCIGKHLFSILKCKNYISSTMINYHLNALSLLNRYEADLIKYSYKGSLINDFETEKVRRKKMV